jgi:DNA-binding MarR family transcriptional regulator
VSARLQHELKKTGPFDSPEQEAALQILRTNDQMQIRFTRLFREHGLTGAQYNVLRILRGEGGPLPILEIASRTVAVVPGITGLIDRLEEAGFVRRDRCAKDRRVVYVSLTEKAAQTLAGLDGPVRELHRQLMAGLSGAELAELTRLLEKVRAGLTPAG